MRKIFFGILTLLLFVSCGKHQDSEEGLAIFKYNESSGILTLDPIYAKDLPHIWACNQVFNSLVAFDDQMIWIASFLAMTQSDSQKLRSLSLSKGRLLVS